MLEKVQISIPIIVAFVGYSLLMLGIGFYFLSKTKPLKIISWGDAL